MGCCRGNRRPQPLVNERAPCKAVEQGGAGLKFWVTGGSGGPVLVVNLGQDGGRYEILSYLQSNGCDGSTARTVKANINHILSAVRVDSAAFKRHANGVSLVKLLRIADSVSKNQRRPPSAALRSNPKK